MTINCKGCLIDLETPQVMGILNLTPDSFYDGGKYKNPTEILKQIEIMLKEGATFIDLGAYSSRPGAAFVDEDEEIHRVLPIVALVLKEFPQALVSIDTFRSRVAKKCLEIGAVIINDISGGAQDDQMWRVVSEFGVPYIGMHMRGTPQTMQGLTDYENVTKEVIYQGSRMYQQTAEAQIKDFIFDPGFGFAKTIEQNYQLLNELELLKILDCPILIGISRKSMIYKTLEITPKEALNGTTALHMIALNKGANILRVHDVKEAKECIRLWQMFPSTQN